MFHRNKRVLWLLNHKTLMAYEAKLLLRLGFEVFVPKVIPARIDFCSGIVDFIYDESLSIPRRALKRLNEFNFYERVWPSDVVMIVNRYFGTVFTMPYSIQFPEVLNKFVGQIVFRAFGLVESNYKELLTATHGFDSLLKIHALGNRFWFGEGYEQLRECEPPVLSDRELFLPIGVPESFYEKANQWNGSTKKILFVCPNVISNPYYSAVYKRFKQDVGDLPHLIVGGQDVKVNDASMLGYVSDEELQRLYLDCAVLYYHSTELRHVHYTPIEAAIIGMPIVFFRSSLLGRLCEGSTPGCVDSVEEARTIIQRVLAGDKELIERLRQGQRNLSDRFSDAYCKAIWEKSLIESGFRARLDQEQPMRIRTREALRCVLAPIAGGLASVPFHPRLAIVPSKLVSPLENQPDRTLEQGIDFTESAYPKFVLGTNGISRREFWGRWSVGKKVEIFFQDPLPKRFSLLLTGWAHGPNMGAHFNVRIGNVRRYASFRKGWADPETLSLEFSLRRSSRIVEIDVPHPTIPEQDIRAIGLGFVSLKVAPAPCSVPSEIDPHLGKVRRQKDEANDRMIEQSDSRASFSKSGEAGPEKT